ncbi:hypothetical protein LguiA_022270 [Lonicera macranthoides]
MIRKYFGIAARRYHAFSRETIKPSTPTPSHLKRYNLSSIDMVMFRNYIPLVFYFPNSSNSDRNPTKIAEKTSQLKHSLSKTLAQYYPFAGRFTSGAYVDCNDQGIEFQEARIKSKLSEVLEKDNDVALDLVLPFRLEQQGVFENDSSIMVVRLSHFDCGGIALAVCLSHKAGDACTFSTFLAYWAAVTRQSGEEVSPHFISSPANDPIAMPEVVLPKRNWVTKRFVFPNTKIAQLKNVVASSGVENPSRVESLSALLYKCAMSAKSSSTGSFTPSAMFQVTNMRDKMNPPLPITTVGNFLWHLCVPTANENESNLNSIVDQIKKAKKEVTGVKVLDVKDLIALLSKFDARIYKGYYFSSICNLEMYKMDFGWGKPVRVTLADVQFSNSVILMDTPSGDGIEAQVSLDNEQEMAAFKHDKELSAYASLQ